MRAKSRKTPLGWFVAYCGAGLVIAFFVLPIAFLVSVSFKSPDQALSGHFLPGRPTLDNWRDTFQIIPLVRYLFNSVSVAFFSAILTVAFAFPATYAMVRLKIGGRFLSAFTLATYVAPPVVALIPLFLLLRRVRTPQHPDRPCRNQWSWQPACRLLASFRLRPAIAARDRRSRVAGWRGPYHGGLAHHRADDCARSCGDRAHLWNSRL